MSCNIHLRLKIFLVLSIEMKGNSPLWALRRVHFQGYGLDLKLFFDTFGCYVDLEGNMIDTAAIKNAPARLVRGLCIIGRKRR